mgnify:CR=1 FL=1
MKPELIVSTFMSSTAAYSGDGKKYRYFYEHLVGHASLEHFLPLVNFNEFPTMHYFGVSTHTLGQREHIGLKTSISKSSSENLRGGNVINMPYCVNLLWLEVLIPWNKGGARKREVLFFNPSSLASYSSWWMIVKCAKNYTKIYCTLK